MREASEIRVFRQEPFGSIVPGELLPMGVNEDIVSTGLIIGSRDSVKRVHDSSRGDQPLLIALCPREMPV